MECKVFKKDDYSTSEWAGGKTRQLAIFPENGDYKKREFIWRLSSATCELDESKFTSLPNYDRTLVVLKGSVVLAHRDVRTARLGELEQDQFDGGWDTTSFGKITDYNLMVHKGSSADVRILDLTEQNQKLDIGPGSAAEHKASAADPEHAPNGAPDTAPAQSGWKLATQALFVRDGYAAVDVNGRMVMVREDEQLVINYDLREKLELSVMGEGHAVWCQIFYNYDPGEFGPTPVEAQPASASDFGECRFIAHSQFRLSRFTNKRLKKVWFDEELQKGIRKINRIYLPEILLIGILVLILALGAGRISGPVLALLCIAWVIADWELVTPLLYLAALPKPVSAHIRPIEALTPYERRLWEKQNATNERVDRILGRYTFTGTATYDEDGNRTDDYRFKGFR